MIKNKRILLAGGSGSIGSELCRQLAPDNKIFVLDNNESGVFNICEELKKYWVKPRVGDIRDRHAIRDLFEDFKPQIVINAAALKHVHFSHIYPRDYIDTNIIGNLNLVEEAKRWECLERYVFISTDKVLSESIMGATKKCSEQITLSSGKKFVAVRFGNVLNSRGSVLKTWERQFSAKEPLTITDIKMERYIMTIPSACRLVIKAITANGKLFIMDMGKPKNIINLKKEIYGDYPYKIIGIREGEVLEEKLMTEEERSRAVKKDEFFIIK